VGDNQPLLIKSTDRRLTAPAEATPGPATFESLTTAEGSGWVGLARLGPEVDWQTFRGHLQDTVSDDQDRIVRGSAALKDCATLLGGAVVHPGMPGEFTVDLLPGPHVLFDYPAAAGPGEPRFQPLNVAGSEGGRTPEAAGTIRAVRQGRTPRFEVHGTPAAEEPLAFENAMPGDQFVEFVLFPVSAETGEPELAAYFAQFIDGSGEWPPDPPFDLAGGCGCLPLSAGQRAVNRLPAKPGRYVVVNWLKDAADGVRMAKRGQYQIVDMS
jgi:hypothetical protein